MGRLEDKEEVIVAYEVPPGYHEEGRLDVYLARFLQNASRTKVQRAIKQGLVTVNGRVVRKPSHTVLPGDTIRCRLLRPPPVEVAPEAIPLDIVYEDEYLIVVNKRAGMVVHPAYGNRTGTLVNALLHHVGAGTLRLERTRGEEGEDEEVGLSTLHAVSANPEDRSVRPGIVHRLDKDTSGLLVVAKDDESHRRLARQFARRTISRLYLALVWGVPDPSKGAIETLLGRDPRDRKRMAVVAHGGKHAVTHYETLEAMRYTALLRFRLETGRTHQIRVHAQHIGHPVFGDPVYGGNVIRYGLRSSRRRAFYKSLFEAMPRQALHAHTLGFVHPRTGREMHFTAALPEDMQFVLERLREVEGEASESRL